MEHWNTYLIRKSRHDTISGRPDSLYYLAEYHGGVPNLISTVQDNEMQYARSHVMESANENNDYQDYFHYVIDACALSRPNNWKEALKLYKELIKCANNES